MPTKQGTNNSHSWQVQFRVNTLGREDSPGAEILRILEDQKAKNPELTDGDIYNYALLQLHGKVRPVTSLDKLLNKIERLEGFVRNMPKEIARQIVPYLEAHGIDPAQYKRDDGRTLGDDIGEMIPEEAQDSFFNFPTMTFDDE